MNLLGSCVSISALFLHMCIYTGDYYWHVDYVLHMCIYAGDYYWHADYVHA